MNGLMSLYYLIPSFVILLLICPIFTEIRVSVNPSYNRGVVALFVFGKKLFYYIVSLKGDAVELENEKQTKMQKLEFSSPQFLFMEEFMRQIKDKVRLKKMYVFYNIGSGDAFSSALICGLVNQILTYIFLYMKSKKPTASFCIYDTVSYNRAVCEIAGRMSASITLFDVLYSFVYSFIVQKRQRK